MTTTQSPNADPAQDTFDNPYIGKVVCVGRNYAAHAEELGNAIPKRPILFIKPASSIVGFEEPIAATFEDKRRGHVYPLHYEAELCVQLGRDLKDASLDEVRGAISGVTLGLDLTLRDLQTELKEQGHPWERAKCFDGATVLGEWVTPETFGDFSSVKYQLFINDKLTQLGDTALMLFPVYELLVEISHAFSLEVGDVIMTGTPSGVGVLNTDDRVKLTLGGHTWETWVE